MGLRLWEIGALASRSIGLREAAMPFLGDLYEATHAAVQLAVLDGDEAVYLERLSGRDTVHVVTTVGSRLPLHATSVGLVLLAHAPPELIDAVLAGRLRAFTPRTVTDPVRLRRVLADVRRAGHAVTDRQIELISASVAVPVRDRRGEVVAALSVVVDGVGTARRCVPALAIAARGISRTLAGR